MIELDQLKILFEEKGLKDFKFINPNSDITIEQWVRFRCLFGCGSYGKCASCPPAMPSIEQCREMIKEYKLGVIFHLPVPYMEAKEYNNEIKRFTDTLLEVERLSFINGYYKTFLIACDDCKGCSKCIAGMDRANCINPKKSRPSAEAMGINVYQTARDAGYHIEVVREFGDSTDRFAFLLLD